MCRPLSHLQETIARHDSIRKGSNVCVGVLAGKRQEFLRSLLIGPPGICNTLTVWPNLSS